MLCYDVNVCIYLNKYDKVGKTLKNHDDLRKDHIFMLAEGAGSYKIWRLSGVHLPGEIKILQSKGSHQLFYKQRYLKENLCNQIG